MNSVEALDFALQILRNRQRRVAPQPDGSSPTADAIETLSALRQLIEENERILDAEESNDDNAQQSFWNAYVR